MFRSAALDDLASAGVAALHELGIRTVIDLRDESEKRSPAADRPWQVVDVPLYDPRSGAPVLGDIDTVYALLLRDRATRIVDAIRAVAHSPGPVLLHCTAGKDRTGLVVALALTAVGVDEDAILSDYARSGDEVRPRRERIARDLLDGLGPGTDAYRRGLELHLDSPPVALERALAQVRDEYGSVPAYLHRHGFTETDLTALHDRLCGSTELRVLHVSDVHATTGGNLFRRVDGTDRLRQVTETVAEWSSRPDAVVLTGDLCQSGELDAYPALADAVAQMRTRLGCPVLAVPGNHDHPEHFAAAFGTARTLSVRGYRIVGLDTSSGGIPDDQLDWLASTLTHPAPEGTILAMHHPPIPAAAAALVGRELADPGRLARVIKGTDVRMILAGHFHHPMSGVFGEVPVWVGGSLAYLQHTGVAADTVVGLDAPSFSIVRIDRDRASGVPVPLAESDVLFRSTPGTTVRAAHPALLP